MTRTEELTQSLNHDISRDYIEADSDQAVGPLFGGLRAVAIPAETPEQDEAGERLDHGVGAESDQGDRSGGDPSGYGDRGLDRVPGDTNPGQQPRPPHESQSPNVRTGLCYR
jgi:hypothetical protein